MKLTAGLAACIGLLAIASAQAPKKSPAKSGPGKPGAAIPAASANKAGAPKFKAIWEPVPFNKDIEFHAIACVGPETCWVAGDKSTILATTDGGKSWNAQLGGDPESTDAALTRIFFLDAKHGWAMNDGGRILGTKDGTTWADLSKVSGTAKGVWFVTPQTGFELENSSSTTHSTLQRSEDGGKTWKPTGQCSVDATIEGLPRKLGCMMRTMQFLSPAAGFMGGGSGISMGGEIAAFGKTSDGGQTWKTSVIPETKYRVTDLKFWTEKDGIVVLSNGERIYWTADGGETWTGSVKERLWPAAHAVGEGKIVVAIGEDGGIAYSFNGGRNFTSRPFKLPARIHAVTFPDAQHGYVVGRHGLVYRYRIVAGDYTSQGMLPALAP
jgi:photosystem II stability/assembly factor-like uncharacterized protein